MCIISNHERVLRERCDVLIVGLTLKLQEWGAAVTSLPAIRRQPVLCGTLRGALQSQTESHNTRQGIEQNRVHWFSFSEQTGSGQGQNQHSTNEKKEKKEEPKLQHVCQGWKESKECSCQSEVLSGGPEFLDKALATGVLTCIGTAVQVISGKAKQNENNGVYITWRTRVKCN